MRGVQWWCTCRLGKLQELAVNKRRKKGEGTLTSKKKFQMVYHAWISEAIMELLFYLKDHEYLVLAIVISNYL